MSYLRVCKYRIIMSIFYTCRSERIKGGKADCRRALNGTLRQMISAVAHEKFTEQQSFVKLFV